MKSRTPTAADLDFDVVGEQFVHADNFIDDGNEFPPPKLGEQLLKGVSNKYRTSWQPFFLALQEDASRSNLADTATSILKKLLADKKHGVETAATSVEKVVDSIKWPLDAPLTRALSATEREINEDPDSLWTDLEVGDFVGKLTEHLGPKADPPHQQQSSQTRALLMRAIQAISDAVPEPPDRPTVPPLSLCPPGHYHRNY